jgi:hypothetical protein
MWRGGSKVPTCADEIVRHTQPEWPVVSPWDGPTHYEINASGTISGSSSLSAEHVVTAEETSATAGPSRRPLLPLTMRLRPLVLERAAA